MCAEPLAADAEIENSKMQIRVALENDSLSSSCCAAKTNTGPIARITLTDRVNPGNAELKRKAGDDDQGNAQSAIHPNWLPSGRSAGVPKIASAAAAVATTIRKRLAKIRFELAPSPLNCRALTSLTVIETPPSATAIKVPVLRVASSLCSPE